MGGNYKEKLHPWYLATPLWPWHNMGKEAKKKSEGSRVQIQVSSDICVLLLWTIIKRPLVLHIASVISPGLLLLLYGHDWKRVVKNIEVKKEILGIFRACCWSVLYYGKSEGQWARCLKIGRNLGQIYWSWRSWNPPPTSRAKSNKNPVKTLLSLSNGMVRLPEKRINLNKIPERKYPYLLKLV